ncbi:hypothetical protein BIY37_06120 [Candidatus Brocadia sapporoensis]|uniref:Uncharacterized protein n=1 Tax=Candidatus Brocadia sapporoensis TaxID=392547 RepID=A0A1V6M0E6_9BACT|nr:hypothetical protein [Candidatus Brocadia sapporoensis]MDG6004816.1 hypothetical protein [Candidatus Brocadia sp.]OQD45884.1 hypothetical protein BIY37_06120 [Candidatus Brocadia sapporoensis]GJQ22834.1 MAG: hypothetical protein HBSAPP01_06240 [Candidatus Brocadia sapporoensis]
MVSQYLEYSWKVKTYLRAISSAGESIRSVTMSKVFPTDGVLNVFLWEGRWKHKNLEDSRLS